MQVYTGGSVVEFALPFELSLPSAASYTLKDELGNAVAADVVVPVYADDTFLTLTIPAEYNMLAGKDRSLRSLTLTVTNDSGGSVEIRQDYVIVSHLDLAVPAQSFQTIGESALNAMDVPSIEQLEAAPDYVKRKALIEAAKRISSLPFDMSSQRDGQRIITDFFSYTDDEIDLQAMTTEQWASLDAKFKEALVKAQLVEANDILGGNPIEDQRRAGLLSHTVSESKHMYRTGKPIQMAVGNRAMRYLSGYIKTGGAMRVGRG